MIFKILILILKKTRGIDIVIDYANLGNFDIGIDISVENGMLL